MIQRQAINEKPKKDLEPAKLPQSSVPRRWNNTTRCVLSLPLLLVFCMVLYPHFYVGQQHSRWPLIGTAATSPFLTSPNKLWNDAAKGHPSLPVAFMQPKGGGEINAKPKPKIDRYLKDHWEEDMCHAAPSASAVVGQSQWPLLPMCPSWLIHESQRQQSAPANTMAPPHPPLNGNNCITETNPPSPFEEAIERITIKVLKLALTNRGCNELFSSDRRISSALHSELADLVRTEHKGALSVLVLAGEGSAFGAPTLKGGVAASSCPPTTVASLSINALARYLEGTGQLSFMSLSPLSASLPAATAFSKSSAAQEPFDEEVRQSLWRHHEANLAVRARAENLAIGAFSASSVAVDCLDDTTFADMPPLRWIPSNTFSSVMAFDRLSYIPSNQVCDVVADLLRVTKTGGAVWAGLISDPRQIQALSQCRFEYCGDFSVELSRIKERNMFGSVGLPADFLKLKPISFLWRKNAKVQEELDPAANKGRKVVVELNL